MERLGNAICRRPWVAFAVTMVIFLWQWSAGTRASDDHDGTGVLEVGALVVIAYGLVAGLILVPRYVIPRARVAMPAWKAAVMRWAYGLSPFLFGFAALMSGGHQWVTATGFAVSAVVLGFTAWELRKNP